MLAAKQRATAPAPAPAENAREVLLTFTRWAIDRKIEFRGARAEQRGDSRGLIATQPLSRGDTLVSVPQAAVLSLRPDEIPAAGVANQVWSSVPWWARQSVKLLQLDRASYGPYLAALPDTVDLPMLWSDNDIARLQSPYIIDKVRLEQAQWQQVKTLLQPWLAARDLTASQLDTALCLVRSRTFAGPTFRVPVNVKLGLGAIAPVAILGSWLGSGGVAVSVEAAVGAAAALAAAAAVAAWDLQNASKQVTYVIAPFLDLLNHSSDAATEVTYDWLREAYRVTAGKQYSTGQEVYVSYGELSNDALLELYGFVEANNTNDRYVMRDLGQWLRTGPLADAAAQAQLPTDTLTTLITTATQQGALTDVELRPGAQGVFPQDARATVAEAAQRVLAPDAAGAAWLAADALRHACAAELASLGTTLSEDKAELDSLRSLRPWISAAEPQAPTAPQPPSPPAPPLPDSPVHAAQADAGSHIENAPGTASASSQGTQDHAAVGTAQAAYDAQVAAYEVACAYYEAARAQYAADRAQYERDLQLWQRVTAMGALQLGRQITALEYRIEKKRLLGACTDKLV